MEHFTLAEAAKRYDQYRPKVHGVIQTWLEEELGFLKFGSGIDIACGTGDSTLPLKGLCNEVLAVDLSEEMLNFTRDKGFNCLLSSYENISSQNEFDIITTCMAFHWFDPILAIKKYKDLSKDDAVWLIYNFVFMGSFDNEQFNTWFVDCKRSISPP